VRTPHLPRTDDVDPVMWVALQTRPDGIHAAWQGDEHHANYDDLGAAADGRRAQAFVLRETQHWSRPAD
jgi:hypothetical protein